MEKSCGAVVYRVEGGKRLYLLLHYSEGHWDLPKGHVEAGEGEQQTARREIGEETGISALEFLEGFRKTVRYSFRRGGGEVRKEVVFFLARTGQKEVRLSDEHSWFVWLPYESALKKLTFGNAKEMLKEAEKALSGQEAGDCPLQRS